MRTSVSALIPFLALTLTLALTIGPASAMPPATASSAVNDPGAQAPSGIVVETIDGGGYTYLCLENEGEKKWAAIPRSEIYVGDHVKLAPGMEMGKFTSKTLDRTFESIYFCSGLVSTAGDLPHALPGNGKMPPGHAMPPDHGISARDLPPAAIITGIVAETIEAGGYTYVAVEEDGELTWVASPPIKVAVGESVAFVSGYVMSNFSSKSLGRTFDAIVFSTGLATDTPAPSATH